MEKRKKLSRECRDFGEMLWDSMVNSGVESTFITGYWTSRWSFYMPDMRKRMGKWLRKR